ncbi:hypothetical protein LPJ66_003659 [Kickxella alabastrina]|uniref:Uncharacterized protein n=1 Tax=Kickxella alabastrina TaxID=61397 RepID=A0ACC1ILS3_9FUNG|nr:hypothetical protein LPJ66_003659 [Kickxella alabastrina]
MGLMKKIKGSYMFTHMEVGKYTKRRGASTSRESIDVHATTTGHGTIRAATTEFISEFDRAAEEAQREEQWQAEEQKWRQHRHEQKLRHARANSIETLSTEHLEDAHSAAIRQQQKQKQKQPALSRYKSSMELSASQRYQQIPPGASSGSLPYASVQSPQSGSSRTTAVSTPQASPFEEDLGAFGAEPVPRSRPRGARTARSNMDMQSVYFAPGRNVTMTNQQKQRVSIYPMADEKPQFNKNSASSMDYYVFTPTRRDVSAMPLDSKRRTRGVIAPEEMMAPELHQNEVDAEAERASKNPFVERRMKARVLVNEGWDSASPFTDPLIGSGRGGVDPNDPRKYLNTPMYANQAGTGGVDLLA